MHIRPSYRERVMYRIAPFFICLFLTGIVPVYAQTATPPPNGQVASAIEQTNSLLQQQGAERVFMLLFVVLVLAVAWVAIKPTIANNTASNNALIQATNQNVILVQETQRQNAQHIDIERGIQQSITEATHTLVLLNKSTEALKGHVTNERETGVEAVNTHTDEQHEQTRQAIERIEQRVNTALEQFEELMPRIEDRLRVWDDTIRIKLLEIRSELNASKRDVQLVKGDTDKLPTLPDPAPPAPPAEPKKED